MDYNKITLRIFLGVIIMGILVTGSHTGGTFEGQWNMTNGSRLCWIETSSCIEQGTDGFLYINDINNQIAKSNVNFSKLKLKGLLSTTFIETSPDAPVFMGYPDLDKYHTYNSTTDRWEFRSDTPFEFDGANVEIETAVYVNNIRSNTGSMWFQPLGSGNYIGMRTGAGQDILMDAGDDIQFRDRDNSYAIKMNFDTATGDMDITGDLRAEGEGYIVDNVYLDVNSYTTSQNWTGSDDLTTCLDNTMMTINEDTGVNPLNITYTFTGITSFRNIVICNEYTGNHDVHMAIYNTVTGQYQTMNDIGESDTISCNYKSVGGNDENLINSGEVKIRLYHPQNGVNSHDLVIDCLRLEK